MAQAVQTTYAEQHPVAVAGLVSGTKYKAISRLVETAAGIGFGLAVSQGTAGKQVVIGGSSFLGISIRDVTLIPLTAAAVDKYRLNETLGVITEGDIWVSIADAGGATANAAVYFDATTGVISSAAGGHTVITGARFVDGRANAGLVRVHLGISK